MTDDTHSRPAARMADAPLPVVAGEPTVPLTLTVHVPAKVVLPVATDAAGELAAATGLTLTRYLDARELQAAGVSVAWQDADGEEVPAQRVLAIWAAAQSKG